MNVLKRNVYLLIVIWYIISWKREGQWKISLDLLKCTPDNCVDVCNCSPPSSDFKYPTFPWIFVPTPGVILYYQGIAILWWWSSTWYWSWWQSQRKCWWWQKDKGWVTCRSASDLLRTPWLTSWSSKNSVGPRKPLASLPQFVPACTIGKHWE